MGGRLSALLGNRAPALRSCALAAALLALASCGAGHAPERAANPSVAPRVVSLNPCIDAALVEVAAPGQILALSHYSRDPASSSIAPALAAQYRTTGGTVEEVLALDPDMVLAGSFIAPATRQALADLGIEVATFGIADTPEASFAQLRRISALLGREAQGEALIAKIEAALDRSTAPDGTPPISAILWQPGQIVPGKATLVSHLMRRAGLSSFSAARGMHQADYLSLEALLADPPQVLLVAGDTRAQRHPALAKLRGTRVESFDPSLLYCAGPSMIRAAERLAEIRDAAA